MDLKMTILYTVDLLLLFIFQLKSAKFTYYLLLPITF